MRNFFNKIVRFSPFAFIALLFVMFCQKQPESPVIARVGKSILTVNDFYNSIPPEYSEQITREQNINYIKQWIDTELLYQEALRRRIDHDSMITDRLEKMKKDLLAAEIMNRNSMQNQASSTDDSAVQTYYEKNKENFIRENDVAKYLEIIVTDQRTAWYINKNATKDNFLSLAAEYSQQPPPETINAPFVILDDIQPEVRQAIEATAINTTSNPVKSELGYHIIFVLDKLYKGGTCKEDEVWEDIVNQLSTSSQKENVEKLLADLRLKTNVEFNADLITTGTHAPGSNN